MFFNLNSQSEKKDNLCPFLYNYVNKEQIDGFKWISGAKRILEYGTGTGLSLDLFFKNRSQVKYNIIGVDIAGMAIEKVKIKYPKFQFYQIQNNKIPQVPDESFDAVFMFHVLHHSYNHTQIFKEINAKLKKGGRFLINDLSSNNIMIRIGRRLFIYFPRFIRNKFSYDLVVNGCIPDKYKVDMNLVISQLKKTGFSIEEVGYGHLFFFIFVWFEALVPLTRNKIIGYIYKKLIDFEKYLLRYKFFQRKAELFYIKCIKS